jgi:hypothetical protein
VISRLDVPATQRVDPDGAGPITQGYDPDLREPIAYTDGAGDRATTVRYKTPVRVPCQVEVKTYEELRQVFQGDAPVTTMVFVLHNKDLRRLGLLTCKAGCGSGSQSLKIAKNDRIDGVLCMRKGESNTDLVEPLYIYRIDPGSWGMGPSGTDLKIVYTANRPALPQG